MRSSWRTRLGCLLLAAVILSSLPGASLPGEPAADAVLRELAKQPLPAFIEGSYVLLMRRDPDSLWDSTGVFAAAYGVETYAQMTDISLPALDETHRIEAEILRLLRTLNRESLSEAQRITYDAYEWLLQDRIAEAAYPLWNICIGPSAYGVQTRQLQLLNVLPVLGIQDARDYVTRLRGIAPWMDQLLAGLRARETQGVVPSAYVLQAAAQDLTMGVLQEDAETPDPRLADAYTTFAQRLTALPSLDASVRTTLLDDAAAAIRDSLFPALRNLRDELIRLQSIATSDVGVARFPGGDAYYAQALHHFVGTGASAEALHALGLEQVARIEAELRDFASEQFGWPCDLPMAELHTRIHEAKAEYPEGETLQAAYDRLLGAALATLPSYFGRLPLSELDGLIDPNGPPAYYFPPPFDRSEPGQFVISLANPAFSTMYDETVLVHHETVPGHHLQFALALDLGIPTFQSSPVVPLYAQHPAFQAFTEGWALYGEHLAAEMGLYDDNPVGNLWRLRLELTRAARVVADTGMNALGWTWADTAAYLERALGVRQRQNVLLRYESAPGQACGYNVGYYTILSLRERAEACLGGRFDLREFHDQVLGHGALPLVILERVIDDWIRARAVDAH